MHTHSGENQIAPGADSNAEFDERSRDEIHGASEETLALEQVIAGLKELGAALDDTDLRPDPRRNDWADQYERVAAMDKRARTVLLAPLEKAVSILDEATRAKILDGAANVLAEVAVLAHVSGTPGINANALLAEAIGTASDNTRPELKEGLQSLDLYARLNLARWHLRHGDRQNADAAAETVIAGAPPALLQKGAQEILDVPRPLHKAPSLFTLNGFGTGLYGTRDRKPDGSVVKTHSLCALFIPLLPLGAYRVLEHGEGHYTFLHKEKLSGFAKGWLVALPVMIALFFGGSALASYLGSAKFAVPSQVKDAQAMLAKGNAAAAKSKLSSLFLVHAYDAPPAELDKAALAYARALVKGAPKPFTKTDVAAAQTLVADFKRTVPQGAQLGAAGTFLTEQLEVWAADVGEADPAAIGAGIALLDMAWDVAPGPDARRVEEKQLEKKIVQASQSAAAWPLDALEPLRATLPAEAAATVMARVFDRIPAKSGTWIAQRYSAEQWLAATETRDDLADTRAHVQEGLAFATQLAGDKKRQAIYTPGSTRAGSRWLDKHPNDTPTRAWLASEHLFAGRAAAAVRVLEANPGGLALLDPRARTTLADAYHRTGRAEQAREVLRPLVASELVPFLAIGKEFDRRSKAIQDPIINQLRIGIWPRELETRLLSASDDERKAILTKHLKDKLESDPQIGDLRAQLAARGHAITVGTLWAEVHMDLAEGASGDERAGLLAAADKTLTDLRLDAEGGRSYEAARARLAQLKG